jgi:hypothetical protein
MEKSYYIPNQTNNLTDKESLLLHLDQLLSSSIMMKYRGESLIGHTIQAGTDEDIDSKYAKHYEIAMDILGLNPYCDTQEEFDRNCELVDKSKYNFVTFFTQYVKYRDEIHQAIQREALAPTLN